MPEQTVALHLFCYKTHCHALHSSKDYFDLNKIKTYLAGQVAQ